MLDIITRNPYRILGVYANSSKKEIVANEAKIKAFAKVGKDISFPTDYNCIIGSVIRNEESLAKATSQLTLPKEQIAYAQFWFIKETKFDDIAFNHLAEGNISGAIEIWSKKDTVSSIQNRIVSNLILQNYSTAIKLAGNLYNLYCQEFQLAITGETKLVDKGELLRNFMQHIKSKISIFDFLDSVSTSPEKETLAKESLKPFETKVKELISNTKIKNSTIEDAEELAFECSPYLGEIYALCKYFENGEVLSRRLSTKLGDHILSIVIENVNNALDTLNSDHTSSNEDLYANEVKKGLETIYIIKRLQLEDSFIIGRLSQNENILRKIFDDIPSYIINKTLNLPSFDLRDSRTFYKSCKTGEDYKNYCLRYPWTHNVEEARQQYEDFLFKSCNSIESYINYIENFPNGKYITEAKEILESLLFKNCTSIVSCERYLKYFSSGNNSDIIRKRLEQMYAKKRETEEEQKRQFEKAESFKLVKKLVAYYNGNKEICSLTDLWAMQALKVAKTRKDYKLVATTFVNTRAGKEAQKYYEALTQERNKKVKKWKIWLGIPLGILLLILLIGTLCGNFLGVATILLYGIGILLIIAASIIGFYGSEGKDTKGNVLSLSLIIAFVGAFLFLISGNALGNYNKTLEGKAEVLKHPTLDNCYEFLSNHPNDKDKDKILSLWLSLLSKDCSPAQSTNQTIQESDKPLYKLFGYIGKIYGTPESKMALHRYQEICDSLYNHATHINTKDAWEIYLRTVPTDEAKDAHEKIDSLQNLEWSTDKRAWDTASKIDNSSAYEKYLDKFPKGAHRKEAYQQIAKVKYGDKWSTEEIAWETAKRENSISCYEKYMDIYPEGSHVRAAERKIVELEAERAESNGTALPKMDKIRSGGSRSNIYIKNGTSYEIVLKYYGPVEKTLKIPAGATKSATMPNGNYSIAASVTNGNVRGFYGSEHLTGGDYSIEYYIETSYGYGYGKYHY